MTRTERWLFATSLLASILPYIIIATSLQLLPKTLSFSVEILPPFVMTQVTKYNFLCLGVFCLVPLTLILIARILKAKGVVGKNFCSMVISGLVISVIFLLVSAYGVIYQVAVKHINLLKDFDFMGIAVLMMCILMGMLSNFLPDIKQNDFLGIKNRHTLKSKAVWVKVHGDVNNVFMTVYFTLAVLLSSLSIFLDYSYSWIQLIIWGIVTVVLFVWSNKHSKVVYAKMVAQAPQESAILAK